MEESATKKERRFAGDDDDAVAKKKWCDKRRPDQVVLLNVTVLSNINKHTHTHSDTHTQTHSTHTHTHTHTHLTHTTTMRSCTVLQGLLNIGVLGAGAAVAVALGLAMRDSSGYCPLTYRTDPKSSDNNAMVCHFTLFASIASMCLSGIFFLLNVIRCMKSMSR